MQLDTSKLCAGSHAPKHARGSDAAMCQHGAMSSDFRL